MYQWYKEKTQNIKMKIVEINGIKYEVSEDCSQYLEIDSIRRNYLVVLKIIDKINLKNNATVLKLFFKLLSQFLEKEIKINKF